MTDLFNQETPGNNNNEGGNPQTPQGNPNPYETLLDGIKNERGERKYRNVEDALKGLAHAQSYIPEVKTELNATRAELQAMHEKLKKTEELERIVAELASRQERKPETPGQVFDESKIAELVDRRLSDAELATRERTNKSTVRDALVQAFGDKAAEVFNSKAADFGMTPEDFTSLAGKSPKAVLAMFGVNGGDSQKKSPNPPPGSNINTDGFQGRPSSLRGNREAFVLKPGATDRDVMELANRSNELLKEIQETDGVEIHDLTDPKVFFRYFPQ